MEVADAPGYDMLTASEGGTITILTTYGYIRVSVRKRNEDRQLIALKTLSFAVENERTDIY